MPRLHPKLILAVVVSSPAACLIPFPERLLAYAIIAWTTTYLMDGLVDRPVWWMMAVVTALLSIMAIVEVGKALWPLMP